MAEPIVIDIETKNTFRDVGSYDPTLLDISLVGTYDYKTDTYESFLESELDKLWQKIEKASCIIGYNSNHFDIPIMNKYYMGDLEKCASLDLLHCIKVELGKGIKLDDVAQATLGYGKSGDGLEAIEHYKKGDMKALSKYCLDDVKITKEIFEHGKEKGYIKYQTPLGVNQVKVLFIAPNQKERINYTLPI